MECLLHVSWGFKRCALRVEMIWAWMEREYESRLSDSREDYENRHMLSNCEIQWTSVVRTGNFMNSLELVTNKSPSTLSRHLTFFIKIY